jgi:hypothetical protein
MGIRRTEPNDAELSGVAKKTDKVGVSYKLDIEALLYIKGAIFLDWLSCY